MPTPKSVPDVQRFLGMVNYLGSFIDNLSSKNKNLRDLLKKDIPWHWDSIHEQEFNNLKTELTKTPVLTYFDPKRQLTSSVDVSGYALGATILHDRNPITYASASLTDAQRNYAQIEKELLAILFGCTRFHQYIYGLSILVETDHKSLVSLFKKPLYQIPARLQRFMLRLQAYDLTVQYRPGKFLLRDKMLHRLHESHMGIQRYQNLAKSSIYWPNINNDIYNLISNCETCVKFQNSNLKQELKSHDMVEIPWFKVGCNKFEFNKKPYLLVVDYYSKFIEIDLLNSGYGSLQVITKLKSIFARHGILQIFISDNGPPYNSKEFKQFCRDWNIEHKTSSPYLPRSNGLAERSIQTIKKLLTKCEETKNDPYVALLHYRTTQTNGMPSPAQLLMSRSLTTKIPAITRNFEPKIINTYEYKKRLQKQNQNSSKYYNRVSRNLKPVKPGEKVMFKKNPTSVWFPGVITQNCKEPRSFIVQDSEGVLYRRNREHILKRKQEKQKVDIDLDRRTVVQLNRLNYNN
ncbi:uncharacterized protein LOC129605879 [Condylostylus longicornis]|uniref:uncharacterized protein LOC129605879 n=1 Tax=Condylostylus longicornis TaxID=2530218 RepID=UPI00244DE72F|nr:uncharacterized protein LOC129605879 [Condylostylus longicornis]